METTVKERDKARLGHACHNLKILMCAEGLRTLHDPIDLSKRLDGQRSVRLV
jgi:hypothetical protein